MELTKYQEFIVEKQVVGLLTESQIVFSKRLLELLGTMPKNPILTKILSLQSQDLDIQQNFIDIGSAKDTISFTPERKVKELLSGRVIKYKRSGEGGCLLNRESNQAIFSRLGYTYEPDTQHWNPPSGTIGTIHGSTQNRDRDKTYTLFECTEGENKGKKTVINMNNLSESDDIAEKIWKTNRNSIKIGRLARALMTVLGEKPTDAQIEDFVNKFKASYDIMNDALSRFDIVSGNKIAYWYDYNHYGEDDDDCGSLHNSCMKEVEPDYFDIYVKNPEKCRLIILYDTKGKITGEKYTSDRIVGRALLWNTDEGEIVMDRIYYTLDSDQSLFKRFAFHNGWLARRGGSSWEGGAGNITKDFTISLKKWKFQNYPYCDTFFWFNSKTGKLSNNVHLVGGTRDDEDRDDDYDDDDDDYDRPSKTIRQLSDTGGGWN